MKKRLNQKFQKKFQKKKIFKKNFKNIPVMCYYRRPKITTLICIIYQ